MLITPHAPPAFHPAASSNGVETMVAPEIREQDSSIRRPRHWRANSAAPDRICHQHDDDDRGLTIATATAGIPASRCIAPAPA
jgi:hypothetical protein